MSWDIVVSDASDVPLETQEVATDEAWPKIRILPERPRLGCTKGYNRAFREAKGEWVIWLNDDCTVEPGYAEAAIQFMVAHPHIGLGALSYSENGGKFHVNSYYEMVYANFGIISRELGNVIGWMDESFEMYGCDNSLAFRVLLAGKGIAAIPESRIIHHAINDSHRRENNEAEKRIKEAEKLRDHYAPYLKQMQKVYAATSVPFIGRDQTPKWMWPAAK